MADITRDADMARPVNDYDSLNIVMDVAVEAGQPVYVKSNGKGALADASAAPAAAARGIASMDTIAGRAVALITRGKVAGYSGMTPGADVFVSDTGGELADAAGTVTTRVGWSVSATEIYVEL